jgi:hypothetical protein
MPRKFNNKRVCKGLCNREYLYGIRVFSQKKLPYKKASWCSECEKSVLPPSVDKIVVTTAAEGRQEYPYKIGVRCPCCKNICRGAPHGKSKPKPRVQYPEKPGRREGPDKEKEKVDYWAKIIDERKDSVFGETLEDVPLYLQSKVKKRIDKGNETKTSHVT